jgi:gamma-glutamyltranspeptidase/glutathione hydrolase
MLIPRLDRKSASQVWALALAVAGSATLARAVDLSPEHWPAAERARLEALESQEWTPASARLVEGTNGIISATVSPVSVYAGMQALQHGGNAADAAATTALTQVTMELGSVVSYAGVFTMLYYDAYTHRVFSMDAGFNSYLHETDPRSIRFDDLGPLSFGRKPTEGGLRGRETLVPGFMAGVEAMQGRFGRLPFHDLFGPAIWYARNGVRISRTLAGYFALREKYLARTPEGQRFMRQAGDALPVEGDLFVQHELALTLRAVASTGSSYMYTGDWAQEFVRTVQREGGRVTAEDLERYWPIWSEPFQESVFGYRIYANGPPNFGALTLFVGLNLAEALRLDHGGPYWSDPAAFQSLTRINEFVTGALPPNRKVAAFLRDQGIDNSTFGQLSKEFARAVAPRLEEFLAPPPDAGPGHSNAIVAVDREGNIAVVTHTMNSVVWGDTGIVVGGIPIPDSAAFQQGWLARIQPGDRLRHGIIDTIAFDGDRPVLATASIGTSLCAENIRVLLSVLGRHQGLATVMAAPPVLATFKLASADEVTRASVPIPEGAYGPEFIGRLRAEGVSLSVTPRDVAANLRGTMAAVEIDPVTGRMSAADQPGMVVFNSAY